MTASTAMTIGDRIRQLRHKARLSVAELARAAQLTENTIYRLEGESRQPRADTVLALAAALDVSADELLGIDTPSIRPVEDSDFLLVNLPLLLTRTDVTEGATEMVDVPQVMLPELPHETLAVVHSDEDTPDLLLEDLVIVARGREWADGDLLAVLIGDRCTIRRGYREDGEVLVVGSTIQIRDRIPLADVVGRVMCYTRRM